MNERNGPARLVPTSLAALLALVMSSCGDKEAVAKTVDNTKAAPSAPVAATHPGTEAGAKELLSAFEKPGADLKALSQALRPTKEDYAAVFNAGFATALMALYDPAWEKGELVLTPKDGQTELLLHGVASEEIKAWSKAASDDLPGGYGKIKDEFKSGITVYAFKFVKPGESTGMAYDGLVHVNNHWCIFPKPYRAAK